MNRDIGRFAAFGAWLTLLFSAPDWGLAQSGQEQLLVLKNGNLQRGLIERQLGGYSVRTVSGSRIVIPSDQVDFPCVSLEEAILIKRHRAEMAEQAGDATGRERVLFFTWCLKHGLVAEAQAELNVLQLKKISAAELDGYLRQLHAAMARAEGPTAAAQSDRVLRPDSIAIAALPGSASTDLESAPLELGPIDSTVGHSAIENIRPVSFEEPPRRTNGPVPFVATELERISKALPVEGVSLYRRRIEPLLFRNCSNAGCHDPNKTRWPLMRAARGEGIPRRMSQQNLIQTLAFVGTGQLESSPLLQAAITAHGGAAKAPLKQDSEQFQLLAQWAAYLAEPAKRVGIQPLGLTELAEEPVPPADSPPKDALPLPTLFEPARGGVSPSPSQNLPEIPDLQPHDAAYRPTDPFDPEIFNRRTEPLRSGRK